MQIIHKINDFLYDLFPEAAKGDIESLKRSLRKYYTLGAYSPEVSIEDGFVSIKIDTDVISVESEDYHRVVSYAEQGKYSEARPILMRLISKNPTNSEYHRILGQIYSDEGDQDEAINSLIDALRWDPENVWALLMMGNIFAKYKDDVDTALKYYNQVLKVKPDDNITLNNIGANFMQLGKTKEAKEYFNKALKINSDYANTHYALALVSEEEGEFEKAFKHALDAIKTSKGKDGLFWNSLKMAGESAQSLIEIGDGDKIVQNFASDLENEGGKKIQFQADPDISTVAKMEFAENHSRDYHLIKYKPGAPGIEHLMMHELMHLKLVLEARAVGENKLFITNSTHESKFSASFRKFVQKLSKKGYSREPLQEYIKALFTGMNGQVFNAPIDLFIEDRIYNQYPQLKPYQFLSLISITQGGIEANTKQEIVDLTPPFILSRSKIYNLVNAFHFKDLFGVDLLDEFKPTKLEVNKAKEHYKEFNEYRYNKEPGEEYELVQHWAEDFKLDGFFDLIPEDEGKRKSIDDVMKEMNEDPYGLNDRDSSKERKMNKFLKEHSNEDINPAVASYMVGALNYFNGMDDSEVKKIAFEFATLGMSGISPKKDNYSIPSINKKFSGYQALSYYYASWAIAIPEMVSKLEMPFEREYELAKKFVNL